MVGRDRSEATQGVWGERPPVIAEAVSPQKRPSADADSLFCGDGRSRTAVQTEPQVAFYTLILSLIVGPELPEGRPLRAYPLNLSGP